MTTTMEPDTLTRTGRFQLLNDPTRTSICKAWDARTNQLVALKLADEASADRLICEADWLAKFRHPHIVQLVQGPSFNQKLGHFIALEWLGGQNLKALIKSGQPISDYLVATIGQQACMALEVPHRQGFAHSDIKLSNLVWAPNRGATLIDFETVRAFGESFQLEGRFTARNAAPEYMEGAPIDGRSDIFSLGITLYELATCGVHPFSRPGEQMKPLNVGVHIVTRQPKPLSEQVSPCLRELIMTALEKDPANRFPTVHAMNEALSRVSWAAAA